MLYCILGIMIGIIIGDWWYIVIYSFKEIFSTKTVDELNELIKILQDCRIKNIFIRIIAIVIRMPLLLIMLPFLTIHVAKLYIRESK